jgi:hypothetical protein
MPTSVFMQPPPQWGEAAAVVVIAKPNCADSSPYASSCQETVPTLCQGRTSPNTTLPELPFLFSARTAEVPLLDS